MTTTEVPAFGTWLTNGDLIADAARLNYVHGRVLDLTYGRGRFWTEYTPDVLVTNDLHRDRGDHSVDIRGDVPHEWVYAFDTVVADPPYRMCLDLETEILTRSGWKRYDEVLIGEYCWSLDHDTGLAGWHRIDDINVYPTTEVIVYEGKNLSIAATPDHRWPVVGRGEQREWRQTQTFQPTDSIPLAAPSARPEVKTYSDEFVELVAWFWTEGNFSSCGSRYGRITQSFVANPVNCHRIEKAFYIEFGAPVEAFERVGSCRPIPVQWRTEIEGENVRYYFSSAIGDQLAEVVGPGYVVAVDFLDTLTAEQLKLFIDVSLRADGKSFGGQIQLTQKTAAATERFALACLMDGRAVSFTMDRDQFGVTVKNRSKSRPARISGGPKAASARVWCPTVHSTGTWLARRRGRVCFTGNSGTRDQGDFDDRYGLDHCRDRDVPMLLDACVRFGTDCLKETKASYLLVKCQDQQWKGKLFEQTDVVRRSAERSGLRVVDRFHMLMTPRKQPKGRAQKSARSNYSTLMVLGR